MFVKFEFIGVKQALAVIYGLPGLMFYTNYMLLAHTESIILAVEKRRQDNMLLLSVSYEVQMAHVCRKTSVRVPSHVPILTYSDTFASF